MRSRGERGRDSWEEGGIVWRGTGVVGREGGGIVGIRGGGGILGREG